MNMSSLLSKFTSQQICTSYKLRSEYMLNLFSTIPNGIVDKTSKKIPLFFIQYWNDLSNVPKDVEECINSWKPLEDIGFKRILFDDESASRFIKQYFDPSYLEAFYRCKHPAMRSDFFRLCYLFICGGVYVDADDIYLGVNEISVITNAKLKVRPLCYNLTTNSMVNITKQNLPKIYDQNLIFYVNNNPLIAPPNHPIILGSLDCSKNALLKYNNESTQDIQSMTGPGNLTVNIINNSFKSPTNDLEYNFEFLFNWDEIAVSKWPLDYRSDSRNWRLWDGYTSIK